MDQIYMIKVEVYSEDKLVEENQHGAFTSYRDAAAWLIEEGFEPFFNDELSEFLENETVSFVLVDKKGNLESLANDIDSYYIQKR